MGCAGGEAERKAGCVEQAALLISIKAMAVRRAINGKYLESLG
jgi:hypothetical protein